MSDKDKPEFDYDTLNKRIKHAKTNPLYGISREDLKEFTSIWMSSFTRLQNQNRRKISENPNFQVLLEIISKYPHRKTTIGYIVYVNDCIVSIIGGDGAFCDEMTYEVAILDSKNEFITNKYDAAMDYYQLSLAYQDIDDVTKIVEWCKDYKEE